MASLTELSSKQHKDLKISPKAHINHAAKQHVIQLFASEIANAATCFPIFVTRNSVNGNWAFSAMTSFELSQNLFVENDQWRSIFQPVSLKTYPLYLMQSDKGENQFTIGFNAESDALQTSQGIPLFQEDGKASDHLSQITNMLNNELHEMRQTYEFAKVLEELNLLKEVDLNVQYQDGTVNQIKGLHTINEDSLNMLEAEKLQELNKAGYLSPIHALLISLFQLNALLTKNNAIDGKAKLAAIKMEVSKNDAHG